MTGQFAQRLPEASIEDEEQVEVALPLTCWVIDGKAVRKESLAGEVVRIGRRRLAARLSTPLTPLTNVRLRVMCA